jgi:hypothetical protein
MACWIIRALLLAPAALLAAGGDSAARLTPADSLLKARDSLVNVLRHTGEKEYARIKALSEALLKVETELEKGNLLLSAESSASPAAAAADIFSLEARRLFLSERLRRALGRRDSLLELLTETELEEREESALESELGADSDPRKRALGMPRAANPEQERKKARLVGSLDSLKKEIAALKGALAENEERMRRKLKGGEK